MKMSNHAKKRQKRAASPYRYMIIISLLIVLNAVAILLLVLSVVPAPGYSVVLIAMVEAIVVSVIIAGILATLKVRYISSGNIEVEELGRDNLVAMRAGDRIHGEKVWFRGFVDTEAEYRYLRETNAGGYELASVPAKQVKIYHIDDEDEDQIPRIIHWRQIVYYQNLLTEPPTPLPGTRSTVDEGYDIYVPKDAIPATFELI